MASDKLTLHKTNPITYQKNLKQPNKNVHTMILPPLKIDAVQEIHAHSHTMTNNPHPTID
jgi:hypothetical protein